VHGRRQAASQEAGKGAVTTRADGAAGIRVGGTPRASGREGLDLGAGARDKVGPTCHKRGKRMKCLWNGKTEHKCTV
jgi:hypothetical protein